MRRVATVLITLGLSGCAYATLNPEAENVRITNNAAVVEGCTYIGEVAGRDAWNGGMAGQGVAERNAQIKLKNKAAELGANVVLMVTGATNMSGSTQRGEAYSCTPEQARRE